MKKFLVADKPDRDVMSNKSKQQNIKGIVVKNVFALAFGKGNFIIKIPQTDFHLTLLIEEVKDNKMTISLHKTFERMNERVHLFRKTINLEEFKNKTIELLIERSRTVSVDEISNCFVFVRPEDQINRYIRLQRRRYKVDVERAVNENIEDAIKLSPQKFLQSTDLQVGFLYCNDKPTGIVLNTHGQLKLLYMDELYRFLNKAFNFE